MNALHLCQLICAISLFVLYPHAWNAAIDEWREV
jgi:hypothetical protein